jgi:hypothetical protein
VIHHEYGERLIYLDEMNVGSRIPADETRHESYKQNNGGTEAISLRCGGRGYAKSEEFLRNPARATD